VPELPEVESILRRIGPALGGRTIRRVTTGSDRLVFETSRPALKRLLPGRRVKGLGRAGKYLLLHLDDGSRLLLHLGMTGQLLLADRASRGKKNAGFVPDIHTHLCLDFGRGRSALYFRDVRRFGTVALLEPGRGCERLQKLGIDALQATGAQLHSRARKRRTAIKSLLLDQSVLAGYGNIYADEALFRAGIRPATPSSRLSAERCAALVREGKRVMRRAIASGGSSVSDYLHPDGGRGSYQQEHRVYGREGEPCPRCGAPIVRTVLGGRSTHYCPRCQR
jgi:formamidopyrimidine-DNA glycosylase